MADDWTKRYKRLEDVPETVDLWGMTIGRRFVEEVYGTNVFSKLGSYQGEVMFFHGGYDSIVPISYSERGSQLYAQSELIVYEEEGHGFSEEGNQLVRERVVDFILHKK